MPTAYKGKLKISCTREACSVDPVRADVGIGCPGCEAALLEIVDFEGRVLMILENRECAAVIDPEPFEEAEKAPAATEAEADIGAKAKQRKNK